VVADFFAIRQDFLKVFNGQVVEKEGRDEDHTLWEGVEGRFACHMDV
jgi:hypothetical protein